MSTVETTEETVKPVNDRYPTREQWLEAGVELLSKRYFFKTSMKLGPISVSCGVPSLVNCVGECWPKETTKGSSTPIFICPSHPDGVAALDTLLHELVHACVGCAEGHGKEFQRVCGLVGLTEGKPKSASANAETIEVLKGMVDELGPFPNVPLNKTKPKKPSTPKPKRVKLFSPVNEDYMIEIREDLLEASEPPLCPLSKKPMAPKDEDE